MYKLPMGSHVVRCGLAPSSNVSKQSSGYIIYKGLPEMWIFCIATRTQWSHDALAILPWKALTKTNQGLQFVILGPQQLL